MQEILNLLRESSPTLIILVVFAYFLKFFIEKKLEGIAWRIKEIGKTTLVVKKELRVEEPLNSLMITTLHLSKYLIT